MTTKKSQAGLESEVMGLWVCKSASKWNFPRSQKVKRSVVSTVLQKCQGMFPAWPKREKRKCRMLLEECGPFWLLDTQTTFEDSSPAFPTTIKEPCVPNGKSVLLFKPHKPSAYDRVL